MIETDTSYLMLPYLKSINPSLDIDTVHSPKHNDITTKIAFTKNQLSPDNS